MIEAAPKLSLCFPNVGGLVLVLSLGLGEVWFPSINVAAEYKYVREVGD